MIIEKRTISKRYCTFSCIYETVMLKCNLDIFLGKSRTAHEEKR